MPVRNLISIVGAVALGTWAYFGVVERLNKLETKAQLMQSDLEKNSEFRINTPQSATEKEAFMLIEHISGQLESLTQKVNDMLHNKVNITRLQKDTEKVQADIEKLKDQARNLEKHNGS
jgi:predicted ATP-grasp superfamily ATP-dependent carboligase